MFSNFCNFDPMGEGRGKMLFSNFTKILKENLKKNFIIKTSISYVEYVTDFKDQVSFVQFLFLFFIISGTRP